MKKIFLTVLCVCVAFGTMAQQTPAKQELKPNSSYLVQGLWSNWFISVGVGAQTFLGKNVSIGIAPAFDFGVGKWFTPVMGVRAQLSGFNINSTTKQNSPYNVGKPDAEGNYDMDFKFFQLHADFLFNFSAQWFKYNPERCYELIAFAGLGGALGISQDGFPTKEFVVDLGIINQFRVTEKLDVELELKGMVARTNFDGVSGFPLDMNLGLTVGASYKLGKNYNFVAPELKDPTAIPEVEVNEMVQKAKKQAQEEANANIANVKKQAQAEKANLENKIKELEKNANKPAQNATNATNATGDVKIGVKVFFEIGKTTLNDMNEENLNYFAEQIKNSNSVYTIKGYADKTTGSKARNQKLANDRAKNVYDILIKKGVSEKNLKVADPGEIVAPNGRDAKFVRMVEIK